MQVNISTRHGHLGTESQEKIKDKVLRLTRFFERITAVDVTVDLEHDDKPEVEIRVSAEKSDGFVATDSCSSLLGALDNSIHKMEQQLRKHKERLKDHRGPGLKDQQIPTSTDSEE
ncbi:MAG: ribosomal subunit interface protein [Blastopirellula sp.]|nr:MAG: ribosomal subunit interface protein [Blastopirellula sp.]